ncbi:hypothetical protein C8J57DRAFT_1665844 [Mycena rebaudengoi]|nr:hypothetical protein C8J57DRAFT_1665844 [Mycena rebaudengoi]
MDLPESKPEHLVNERQRKRTHQAPLSPLGQQQNIFRKEKGRAQFRSLKSDNGHARRHASRYRVHGGEEKMRERDMRRERPSVVLAVEHFIPHRDQYLPLAPIFHSHQIERGGGGEREWERVQTKSFLEEGPDASAWVRRACHNDDGTPYLCRPPPTPPSLRATEDTVIEHSVVKEKRIWPDKSNGGLRELHERLDGVNGLQGDESAQVVCSAHPSTPPSSGAVLLAQAQYGVAHVRVGRVLAPP